MTRNESYETTGRMWKLLGLSSRAQGQSKVSRDLYCCKRNPAIIPYVPEKNFSSSSSWLQYWLIASKNPIAVHVRPVPNLIAHVCYRFYASGILEEMTSMNFIAVINCHSDIEQRTKIRCSSLRLAQSPSSVSIFGCANLIGIAYFSCSFLHCFQGQFLIDYSLSCCILEMVGRRVVAARGYTKRILDSKVHYKTKRTSLPVEGSFPSVIGNNFHWVNSIGKEEDGVDEGRLSGRKGRLTLLWAFQSFLAA